MSKIRYNNSKAMIEINLYSLSLFLTKIYYQLILDFADKPPDEVVWIFLFKYWGWLLIIYFFLRYLAYEEYMYYIQNRWFAQNVQMTILAIDVPKRNEQSVQAMENFFDHLQGAHATITLWEKYIEGVFQLSFSCELVSIEGNVQFLIRTPSHWRNLVEAAVYAQYPDAEITEVNDYVHTVPKAYPNETHDMWGCEFTLSNKNVYLPIKTYIKFEHRFSEVFVDPMAALLETMSQIGPGEQIWIQFLLKPLAVDWGLEKGKAEINKILGKAPEAKKGIFGLFSQVGAGLVSEFTTQLADVSLVSEEEEKKVEGPTFKVMNLTPGQKEQLESMERKIAKLAFNTKVRFIYVTEKGKMNKGIGVNGIIGAIKQWTDMNLNGFKPDLKPTGTNAPQYVLIEYRRNSRRNWLLDGYIKRDGVRGDPAKPLCSEELASIWHFPSMYVKAPLLRKTEFTKVAAPVGLPFGEAPAMAGPKELGEVIAEKTQVIPTFDYDNDTFEMQFAKDKNAFKQSRPAREERLKEITKEDATKLKQIEKQEKEAAKAAKKVKESSVAKAAQGETKVEKAPATKTDQEKPGLPDNLPFID